MQTAQQIALAEFNIALDAIERKIAAVENGASFGPWNYATRAEALSVHASIVRWEFDAQKTYSGLRSHWNHPNRWLGKNACDWTVAIVPHEDRDAVCFEVTALSADERADFNSAIRADNPEGHRNMGEATHHL